MSITFGIRDPDRPIPGRHVNTGADPHPTPVQNPVAAAAVDRLVNRRRDSYADDASRLISACRELIAESGPDPQVSRVLERAKLSSRAFYRLFNSKDELLLAVYTDSTQVMATHVREAMATADSPRSRVLAWVRAAISPYEASSGVHTGSLLRQIPNAPELAASFAALRNIFLEPLEEALGDLRPDRDAAATHRVAEYINHVFSGTASGSEARQTPVTAAELADLERCVLLLAEQLD